MSQHLDLLREIFPGRAAIALSQVSDVIPIASRTLINQHSQGKLEFPTFKVGKLIFVSLPALASWLDERAGLAPALAPSAPPPPRRPGRPRKTAHADGMVRGAK